MIDTARKRGRPVQEDITENQRRALEKLIVFTELKGFCPSMIELGESLGISPSSAQNLVNQLERKGYVRRNARRARSIQVLKEPVHDQEPVREFVASMAVPVLGTLKAGPTMLAEEHRVGMITVSAALLQGYNATARLFALRVSDDSMIEAGIYERDLVIVQQQPIAEDGETIAALLDGEATVKRLHISRGAIELRAANKDYQATNVSPDCDFRILGKVVGLVRGYEV